MTGVVTSGVPLKLTTDPLANPVPVTVMVVSGLPTGTRSGLRPVITGVKFESLMNPGEMATRLAAFASTVPSAYLVYPWLTYRVRPARPGVVAPLAAAGQDRDGRGLAVIVVREVVPGDRPVVVFATRNWFAPPWKAIPSAPFGSEIRWTAFPFRSRTRMLVRESTPNVSARKR